MPVSVKAKKDESNDDVIRKFKKKVVQDQILTEVRKREFYKKPSVIKKEKFNEIKRKRKYEEKMSS